MLEPVARCAALVGVILFVPTLAVRAEEPRDVALARQVALDIVAADNARDLSRVLHLYAGDAVLLPPGEPPVHGKEAIRERYEVLFATYRPEIAEVRVAGQWASIIGRTHGPLQAARDDESRSLNDSYLMILSRTAPESWKISRLMWHAAGSVASNPPQP